MTAPADALLKLLGLPRVEHARPLPGLPAKAFVLFAILRLAYSGIASREVLREVLWESAGPVKSRDSLRTLLSQIQKWQNGTGVTLVKLEGQKVSLVARSDIDELLGQVELSNAAEVERLAGYSGAELLSGLDSSLGPQLTNDVNRWRSELRRHVSGVVLPAARNMGGAAGERILRALLASQPDDEEILRALLTHLARERGAAAAKAEYERFSSQLESDAGLSLSIETQSLYAHLVGPVAAGPVPPHDATNRSGGIPRIAFVLAPPVAASQRASGLAAALIEDVTLRLCRQRTFAMLAPHSAQQLSGADPVAAAAPVGVDYVAVARLVPGSSVPSLNVALIRVSDRTILFGDRLEFDEALLDSRFAELAFMIASRLSGGVEEAELAGYRRTGAASAYVHFLLGARAFDPHDLRQLRRARHAYERALRLDPSYVPALTGIARCLTKEALVGRQRDEERVAKALELAARAEKIDPLDPNGPREKAHASLYLHDIDAGLAFVEVALSRARHHADIMAEKAEILVHASRHKQARATVLQAIELNPLAPDIYFWTLGSAEFFLGRPEAAVMALERMKRPEAASRLMSASAFAAGDRDKSERYRQAFLFNYPDATVDSIRSFMPHKNRADVEAYIDALRRAGFP